MRKLAVIFSLLVFLTPAIYGENSTVENRLIPIPNESSIAGAFAKFLSTLFRKPLKPTKQVGKSIDEVIPDNKLSEAAGVKTAAAADSSAQDSKLLSQSNKRVALGVLTVGSISVAALSKLPKVNNLFTTLQATNNLPTIPLETLLRNSNQDIFKIAAPAVVKIIASYGEDQASFGTGTILSDDGFFITNWHVIEQSEKIIVQLYPNTFKEPQKKKIYQAELIKTDPKIDLALLKILRPPRSLAFIPLSERAPEIGEEVHTIGHPFGEWGWTYSRGYISQIRDNQEWEYDNSSHLADVIQTGTDISPGNSGGPMLDDRAFLLGVNTFVDQTPGAQGINFAVSSAEVKEFLEKPLVDTILPIAQLTGSINFLGSEDRDGDGVDDLFVFDMDENGVNDLLGLDEDGDGRIDTYIVDMNENEVVDAKIFDLTMDGRKEIVWVVDENEDGVYELIGVDYNRDGFPDSLVEIEAPLEN